MLPSDPRCQHPSLQRSSRMMCQCLMPRLWFLSLLFANLLCPQNRSPNHRPLWQNPGPSPRPLWQNPGPSPRPVIQQVGTFTYHQLPLPHPAPVVVPALEILAELALVWMVATQRFQKPLNPFKEGYDKDN